MEQGLLPATSPQGRKRSHRFSYFRRRLQTKRNSSHLGKTRENALTSGPRCLFSKKGKKVGSSTTTSDPGLQGSQGKRLRWKSKRRLGFNHQTQEAASASAHLAATRRSDAGGPRAAVGPGVCSLPVSECSAWLCPQTLSGASDRRVGGLLPCPLCAFPLLSGQEPFPHSFASSGR